MDAESIYRISVLQHGGHLQEAGRPHQGAGVLPPSYRQALVIYEEVYGKHHPTTAKTRYNIELLL